MHRVLALIVSLAPGCQERTEGDRTKQVGNDSGGKPQEPGED